MYKAAFKTVEAFANNAAHVAAMLLTLCNHKHSAVM